MIAPSSVLSLIHLVGMALAVGAATAKVALFLRSRRDAAAMTVFLAACRPVTHVILAGMALLAVSGIGFLLLGYALTLRLGLKIAFFAAVCVVGPVIDNVAEPALRAAVPRIGEPASPAFAKAVRRYLALEFLATGLFYAIVVMWVLF